MNTNKAKSIITNWLLSEKNYLGVVTEFYIGFYVSDIIGIKRSLYVSEFELKVNKSDLLRELRIIETITKGTKRKNYSSSKYYKHEKYLEGLLGSFTPNPNEFSFIVTEGLEDILIDYIKDTMYGAYLIKKEHRHYSIVEIKKPKKFHKKKMDYADFKKLFHRVSLENNTLREKLYFND